MAELDPPPALLRPSTDMPARILFLAPHAPEAPDYACRAFPGDGGYPAYHHRVFHALKGLGYGVRTSSRADAPLQAAGIDLVFSLLNRMDMAHPEVLVPALCAFRHLPVVGAAPNIRALAEDKWLTKKVAEAIGLPVAPGAVYGTPAALAAPPPFPGPYFVKNRFGAASEGVSEASIQEDWAGAQAIAAALMARRMSVLVEQYAPGIDVTVPVLGGDPPLVLGLVHPRSDRAGAIVTEALKRDDPLGYALFDAGAETAAFHRDAHALWAAAGPMDYLRLDYRFDPGSGRRTFLEFNICCHIGRSGAICLAAARFGLTQADVLGHVVEYSLARQRARAAAPHAETMPCVL